MKTDNRRADARSALQERIGDELPRLSPRDTVELAGIVERLVEALRPERIYAFGSHARGDATPDSDVDLAVIVARSDGPAASARAGSPARHRVAPHAAGRARPHEGRVQHTLRHAELTIRQYPARETHSLSSGVSRGE